jgi:hypothetical protein
MTLVGDRLPKALTFYRDQIEDSCDFCDII